MALTVTDRGTGGSEPSTTSLVATPGSNFTAGALAVLKVAYDNSGTNGADPYVSISDTKGNTWTARQAADRDPGAANAGVCGRIFTTPQNGGTLTTSDTVTISFGAVTVPAQTYAFEEWTGPTGTPEYVTGGTATGLGAAPSVTTSSITSGNGVSAMAGVEWGSGGVEDGDTTNGSWTTMQQSFSATGAADSHVFIISQGKTTTATSTQTYNTSNAGGLDWVALWIEIRETANVTVTPGTASVALTTFAPTARIGYVITPSTAALVVTTFAPTASIGSSVTPSTKALTLTTFAPSINVGVNVVPTTAALVLTTFVPTARIAYTITPSTAALVLTTFAPTARLATIVTPPTRALVLTSFAPAVNIGVRVTPGTLALALTRYAPAVTISYTPLIVVTINGEEFEFKAGTLRIQHKLDGQSTASMRIVGIDRTVLMFPELPITIKLGNTYLFSGYTLTDGTMSISGDDNTGPLRNMFIDIECVGLQSRLKRRLVFNESFYGVTLKQIATALRTKYLVVYGITMGSMSNGPTFTSPGRTSSPTPIEYDQQYILDVSKDLVGLAAEQDEEWGFDVTPDKVYQWFKVADVMAPYDVDETDPEVRAFKFALQNPDVINRVYIGYVNGYGVEQTPYVAQIGDATTDPREYFEHIGTADSTMAQEAADQILAEKNANPYVVKWKDSRVGWYVGQTLNLSMATEFIEGVFIVNGVSITDAENPGLVPDPAWPNATRGVHHLTVDIDAAQKIQPPKDVAFWQRIATR